MAAACTSVSLLKCDVMAIIAIDKKRTIVLYCEFFDDAKVQRKIDTHKFAGVELQMCNYLLQICTQVADVYDACCECVLSQEIYRLCYAPRNIDNEGGYQ